ncbi:hypothetical protein ACTFIW_013122 [Dictyostelium discoideum]
METYNTNNSNNNSNNNNNNNNIIKNNNISHSFESMSSYSNKNNKNKNNDNNNNNYENKNNGVVESSNTASKQFAQRIKIRPYMTADKEILSNICRLPQNTDFNTLKAYSISSDYSIRRAMSQNGYMFVAEDKFDNSVIGGICIAEKKLKFNGKERIFFYSFDAIVQPKYRSYKILTKLTAHATGVYLKHWNFDPIVYSSTSTGHFNMDRYYESTGMVKFIDQIQHAWKLDIAINHSPLIYMNRNRACRIWIEKDTVFIKQKFNQYFNNYEMCPVDFEDLILNKYWKQTYFATYRCPNGKIIEASISLWDQNKVCTLVNLDGSKQNVSNYGNRNPSSTNDTFNFLNSNNQSYYYNPHNLQENQENQFQNNINNNGNGNRHPINHGKLNFLQLYACYTNETPMDGGINLFHELLKFVHNDCLKHKVDYLFIGLAKTDPIETQFPLLPGIKSLNFTLHFCMGNLDKSLREKISTRPFFQDPRDYGIVMFHSTDPNKHEPLLSNSPISSKL